MDVTNPNEDSPPQSPYVVNATTEDSFDLSDKHSTIIYSNSFDDEDGSGRGKQKVRSQSDMTGSMLGNRDRTKRASHGDIKDI